MLQFFYITKLYSHICAGVVDVAWNRTDLWEKIRV